MFMMAAKAAILSSDQNDFGNFYLHVSPVFPTKFRVN